MQTKNEEEDSGDRYRKSNSSDVVMVEDRAMAGANTLPPIASLNIKDSSQVHVGPKIVSITQHITTEKVVKGRMMGIELVSTTPARRLRCSVAIFVCWAVIVATALIAYVIITAMTKHQTRLNIGLNASWYLRRDDWQAMKYYRIDFLQLPLRYVLIGHTATNYCNERYQCIRNVLAIQKDHLGRGLNDIGPNFLVGGQGYVFEGRGANVQGAMVTSWNAKSISIMFLGDYSKETPDQAQFDHVKILLEVLVKEFVIRSDYILYGHCQVSPFIVSPGPTIMGKLHEFSHWNSVNASTCLPN